MTSADLLLGLAAFALVLAVWLAGHRRSNRDPRITEGQADGGDADVDPSWPPPRLPPRDTFL